MCIFLLLFLSAVATLADGAPATRERIAVILPRRRETSYAGVAAEGSGRSRSSVQWAFLYLGEGREFGRRWEFHVGVQRRVPGVIGAGRGPDTTLA